MRQHFRSTFLVVLFSISCTQAFAAINCPLFFLGIPIKLGLNSKARSEALSPEVALKYAQSWSIANRAIAYNGLKSMENSETKTKIMNLALNEKDPEFRKLGVDAMLASGTPTDVQVLIKVTFDKNPEIFGRLKDLVAGLPNTPEGLRPLGKELQSVVERLGRYDATEEEKSLFSRIIEVEEMILDKKGPAAAPLLSGVLESAWAARERLELYYQSGSPLVDLIVKTSDLLARTGPAGRETAFNLLNKFNSDTYGEFYKNLARLIHSLDTPEEIQQETTRSLVAIEETNTTGGIFGGEPSSRKSIEQLLQKLEPKTGSTSKLPPDALDYLTGLSYEIPLRKWFERIAKDYEATGPEKSEDLAKLKRMDFKLIQFLLSHRIKMVAKQVVPESQALLHGLWVLADNLTSYMDFAAQKPYSSGGNLVVNHLTDLQRRQMSVVLAIYAAQMRQKFPGQGNGYEFVERPGGVTIGGQSYFEYVAESVPKVTRSEFAGLSETVLLAGLIRLPGYFSPEQRQAATQSLGLASNFYLTKNLFDICMKNFEDWSHRPLPLITRTGRPSGSVGRRNQQATYQAGTDSGGGLMGAASSALQAGIAVEAILNPGSTGARLYTAFGGFDGDGALNTAARVSVGVDAAVTIAEGLAGLLRGN